MKSYRLQYSAEMCEKHHSSYTSADLQYMCQWYKVISSREIALALGRTQGAVLAQVRKLKKSGEFDFYKAQKERHCNG